jgi:hypothetical protein
MPYTNMPKELWKDMESCCAKVKAEGKVKNYYAICYSSIMKGNKKQDKK